MAETVNWKYLSFWDRLALVPPVIVRLMARHHRRHKAMTDDEIAKAGGISPEEVALVSSKLRPDDWWTLDLRLVRGFLTGCGVDLANARDVARFRRQLRRLNRRPPHSRYDFIKASPEKERLTSLLDRFRRQKNLAQQAGRGQGQGKAVSRHHGGPVEGQEQGGHHRVPQAQEHGVDA